MNNFIADYLDKIKESEPLIHSITGSNVIHDIAKYEINEVSPYWNFLIPRKEIENNDFIIEEGMTPNEVDGVRQTLNNPNPTNKVPNSTKEF